MDGWTDDGRRWHSSASKFSDLNTKDNGKFLSRITHGRAESGRMREVCIDNVSSVFEECRKSFRSLSAIKWPCLTHSFDEFQNGEVNSFYLNWVVSNLSKNRQKTIKFHQYERLFHRHVAVADENVTKRWTSMVDETCNKMKFACYLSVEVKIWYATHLDTLTIHEIRTERRQSEKIIANLHEILLFKQTDEFAHSLTHSPGCVKFKTKG